MYFHRFPPKLVGLQLVRWSGPVAYAADSRSCLDGIITELVAPEFFKGGNELNCSIGGIR